MACCFSKATFSFSVRKIFTLNLSESQLKGIIPSSLTGLPNTVPSFLIPIKRLCEGLQKATSPSPASTIENISESQLEGIIPSSLTGLPNTVPSFLTPIKRLCEGLQKATLPFPVSTNKNLSESQVEGIIPSSLIGLPLITPFLVIPMKRLCDGLQIDITFPVITLFFYFLFMLAVCLFIK